MLKDYVLEPLLTVFRSLVSSFMATLNMPTACSHAIIWGRPTSHAKDISKQNIKPVYIVCDSHDEMRLWFGIGYNDYGATLHDSHDNA